MPKSGRWPEVTTDIAAGQMHQVVFVVDEEGDWAFHCQKSHHTLNAMGHGVSLLNAVKVFDSVKFQAERINGALTVTAIQVA